MQDQVTRDITGDIGDLYPVIAPKYPMFSYSRPAWLFWQGVYNTLTKKGKTHEEAIEILQHSLVRYALDDIQDEIVKSGERFGEKLA